MLRSMTARTGDAGLASVGVVTDQTRCVFRGRGMLILVAAGALTLHLLWMMRQSRMTRRAIAMPRILMRPLHLGPVTGSTESGIARRVFEAMGRVTARAVGLSPTVPAVPMGFVVASDAWSGSMGQVALLGAGVDGMAGRARSSLTAVRRVVTLLSLMTAVACFLRRGLHIVSRMAVCAFTMVLDPLRA